jgi:hypothetical protein
MVVPVVPTRDEHEPQAYRSGRAPVKPGDVFESADRRSFTP